MNTNVRQFHQACKYMTSNVRQFHQAFAEWLEVCLGHHLAADWWRSLCRISSRNHKTNHTMETYHLESFLLGTCLRSTVFRECCIHLVAVDRSTVFCERVVHTS
ncbi:uncharacterized protein LOC143230521 [Tachypleus tridentatus]|uniref:uncharacterized protein LOC143230521 n=1 Tax=Tachypleus tridentatus TaxID=6853 RepID=UPI003FD57587